MIAASVNLLPEAPPRLIAELAARAEVLGFGRCWVYDEGLAARDVYVSLAAIATRTERILLGPGITNPYTRHPAVTAGAIATLDELSGGRAMLGIGAGGGLTLTPMAIERSRPLTSVREAVAVCRQLWGGHPVDHRGRTVSLAGARLHNGRDGIEVWVAGRGPKMMATGAEIADGFNLSFMHKATIGAAVARLRLHRTGLAISYSTILAVGAAARDAARAHLTYRIVDSPPDVRNRLGIGPDRVAAIRDALARGGPHGAAHLIDLDWVDDFCICGETAAECGAALAELMEANRIDEYQLPVVDMATAHEQLDLVASILGWATPRDSGSDPPARS